MGRVGWVGFVGKWHAGCEQSSRLTEKNTAKHELRILFEVFSHVPKSETNGMVMKFLNTKTRPDDPTKFDGEVQTPILSRNKRVDTFLTQNKARQASSVNGTYVPWSKVAILGMVIPPLIGNPNNGYINPYYWVDDHPLLYGNNGSLDPGT